MSNTKLDEECCDRFSVAASTVGLKVFRSELESIKAPAWRTIRDEIRRSPALFLLVDKKLVNAQALSGTSESWKSIFLYHTPIIMK